MFFDKIEIKSVNISFRVTIPIVVNITISLATNSIPCIQNMRIFRKSSIHRETLSAINHPRSKTHSTLPVVLWWQNYPSVISTLPTLMRRAYPTTLKLFYPSSSRSHPCRCISTYFPMMTVRGCFIDFYEFCCPIRSLLFMGSFEPIDQMKRSI